MLTEDEIHNIIDTTYDGMFYDFPRAAKLIHNQHLAECERLMKLAFNAAKAKRKESDFPYPLEKYRTFQDFKEVFDDSERLV